MKYLLTMLLFSQCAVLFAQTDSGIYAKNSIYSRLQEEINPNVLVGQWQNIDEPNNSFQFTILPHEVRLGDSLFSSYPFHRKSDTTISRMGSLMRWPPSYCYILFVNEHELHLEFSDVAGQNAIVQKYRKVE